MPCKIDKAYRLLQINERLARGENIVKNDTLTEFDIPAKTFQRGIDSLRQYYTERGIGDLVYDRKYDCYRLVAGVDKLTKEDVFAVCKVLIESRAFSKVEFNDIITKMLLQCDTDEAKAVKDVIADEQVCYQ